jgi:hypothetical protein
MSDTSGNRRTGRIGRRSVLKSAAATAAVGTGILGSVGSATGMDPSQESGNEPSFDYKKVDRSVKEITVHYDLLTFSESTIMSFINSSDASPQEKREARETVVDLRSKFPIRQRRDGNVIWLELARDAPESTQDDRKKFQQVDRVYTDGIPGNDQVSTQWATSDHEKHTYRAADDLDVEESTANDVASHSKDPDNITDGLGIPDNIDHYEDVKEAFEYGMKKFFRHWDHYYDTGVYYDYWCYHDGHGDDFGGIGGAPKATDIKMDDAYWYDSYGYDSYRNEALGWALHFLEDVAQPLHSGMGWEQLGIKLVYDSSEDDNVTWEWDPKKTTHERYATYASDNWSSGEVFRYDFRSYSDCCYYDIYDPSSALKGLANKSGEYSYDVYDTILNEEDNAEWDNWSDSTKSEMEDLTSYVMEEEGKYVRGFLKEFF